MRKFLIAAAAAALIAPAASATTAPTATSDANYEREDDNDFPWGLLGLIGLAGLLGRKRDDHVHVDRRDTTGTGTGTRM